MGACRSEMKTTVLWFARRLTRESSFNSDFHENDFGNCSCLG
jgi:hypothetical protein